MNTKKSHLDRTKYGWSINQYGSNHSTPDVRSMDEEGEEVDKEQRQVQQYQEIMENEELENFIHRMTKVKRQIREWNLDEESPEIIDILDKFSIRKLGELREKVSAKRSRQTK
jgi:hypothetical protein